MGLGPPGMTARGGAACQEQVRSWAQSRGPGHWVDRVTVPCPNVSAWSLHGQQSRAPPLRVEVESRVAGADTEGAAPDSHC